MKTHRVPLESTSWELSIEQSSWGMACLLVFIKSRKKIKSGKLNETNCVKLHRCSHILELFVSDLHVKNSRRDYGYSTKWFKIVFFYCFYAPRIRKQQKRAEKMRETIPRKRFLSVGPFSSKQKNIYKNKTAHARCSRAFLFQPSSLNRTHTINTAKLRHYCLSWSFGTTWKTSTKKVEREKKGKKKIFLQVKMISREIWIIKTFAWNPKNV